jgi:hypothetical protein
MHCVVTTALPALLHVLLTSQSSLEPQILFDERFEAIPATY